MYVRLQESLHKDREHVHMEFFTGVLMYAGKSTKNRK